MKMVTWSAVGDVLLFSKGIEEPVVHLAGVEIPFPQSDLHLRTIDKEAATILQQSSR
jgi:hypothetical protein